MKKINIDLRVEVLFQIFKAYSNVINKKIVNNEIILFEIYNLDDKKELEKILLKHVDAVNGKKLITNKSKPLKFILGHFNNDTWSVKIFQENSRGIFLSNSLNVNSLRGELLSIILPINNRLRDDRKRKHLELDFEKEIISLEKKLFLLAYDDLYFFHGRKNITSLEENQILFTYNYYNSMYDKNVSKIDDMEKYNEVLEQNDEIKPILQMLIELMVIYEIERED